MAAARLLTKESAADVKRKSRSQPDLFKVTVEATKTSGYSRNKSVDDELFEICQLSGVKMSQDVFKIILDLLRLNVNPNTISDVVKRMALQKKSISSKETAKSSENLAAPRHGSENVKSKPTKSSLTAVIDQAKIPRAQSLY